MTLTMAFFTFLNAWWISLLLAFPFSVEPADEADRRKEEYAAAPRHIRWKRLVIIATIIALVVTLLLALLIKSGIVPVKKVYPSP